MLLEIVHRKLPVAALLLAVSAAGMSLAESQSAAEKLDRIVEDQLQPGEELTLTDEEINSYLHYDYAAELPDGVRGLRVRFEEDIGVVSGYVDFANLPEGDGSPGGFLLRMLRGERAVEARCRYTSSRGEARVEIESFLVDGREMKGPIMDWLVNTFVAPNMEGFALGRPVPLSHNLEQIRLQPGKAIVLARESTVELD